jgi:glycosyltransferase involved in cell wall biosynthesis
MKNPTRQGNPGRCDGLVCYAVIDWWYHSQGHGERQIMQRLVRSIPVLWINSIGMRFPRPGNTELPWCRYFRKIRSTLKGLRKDASGIWVYSPLFIPMYSPWVLRLNGRILDFQVRLLCRILGIRRPGVWMTLPTTAPAVERRRWHKIMFNRCDLFSNYPEADRNSIWKLEQRALKMADHVLYCSRTLMQKEKNMTAKGFFMGHGVDLNHFAVSVREGEIPAVLSGRTRPLVGFCGSLDAYTIDLPLLIKVARKIFPATLLLVGLKAMDISALLREENVVYLEQVPYKEIPRYARAFDVGIMPWLQNAWMVNANPVKLMEYLAIGFPVVSIDFPELEPYRHLVYSADSHGAFLEMLAAAMEENDPAMRQKRRQAVSGSSWDKLARQVLALLRE